MYIRTYVHGQPTYIRTYIHTYLNKAIKCACCPRKPGISSWHVQSCIVKHVFHVIPHILVFCGWRALTTRNATGHMPLRYIHTYVHMYMTEQGNCTHSPLQGMVRHCREDLVSHESNWSPCPISTSQSDNAHMRWVWWHRWPELCSLFCECC